MIFQHYYVFSRDFAFIVKTVWNKALDFFIESSLKVLMSAFIALEISNPHRLATHKPDVSHVNLLQVILMF